MAAVLQMESGLQTTSSVVLQQSIPIPQKGNRSLHLGPIYSIILNGWTCR